MRLSAATIAVALLPWLSSTVFADALNDSGIQFCGSGTDGNAAAPCTPDPDGQDARYGTDSAAAAGVRYKLGAGNAGLDYTKISNVGDALSDSAGLGSGDDDWACTRDNTTGLTWEVKVDNVNHLRHKGHTYDWYFNPSPDGNTGSEGDTAQCGNSLGGANCNTSTFAAAVRTAQLCGHDDWRVPSVQELKSLVDHGRTDPAMDPSYFPETPFVPYWSSSPYAGNSSYAWYVVFDDGMADRNRTRSRGLRVRLVRGG